MAISGAALQTIPNAIELGAERERRLAIRDALVADPGHVVGSVDFTAMELRLAAGLSGDPVLRAVVESGDPHTAVARELFSTTTPTVRQRAIAKTTNFGVMYGMQCHTLAQRLGVSTAEAQRFLNAWWQRFPVLKRYAAEISDDDRTPWGRRLPVDVPHYAKLNHRIQASGRDIFAAGLLRLEDADLVDHLVLPLHDEYVLALPELLAGPFVERTAALVGNELGGVPLPVEAHVGGRSWGSAK
jgi:DNA polymerase I-like protein with 3'-5' exonuclease and polymerase domains